MLRTQAGWVVNDERVEREARPHSPGHLPPTSRAPFGIICSTHQPSMSGELVVLPNR
jgi:hypothetical protein